MSGQYNDLEYAFLGNLGYTGAINDRWVDYWKDQLTPPVWILTSGTWLDSGAWRDNDVWKDS